MWHYGEKRTRRTVFPRFVEQGYDCGSAPADSQCGKLTVRVKGLGMRQDVDNADAMFSLAALAHGNQ